MFQIRETTVRRKAKLSRERAIVETMGMWPISTDIPFPEMLRDGWQSIFWLLRYMRLCEFPPLPRYSLSTTNYKTSNWKPIGRYTYRRSCRTEYIPDHHPRDQIKQPYCKDYIAKYNVELVMKLHYQEYYPEWDPNSVILNFTTTVAIDNSISASEANLPIDILYKDVWD